MELLEFHENKASLEYLCFDDDGDDPDLDDDFQDDWNDELTPEIEDDEWDDVIWQEHITDMF